MKTETKQDRLEKQRKIFLQIGFIIALALVLTAFEWKTYEISLTDLSSTNYGVIDDELIMITRHDKPMPPPPKVKPVAALKEVDNDTDVEDIELFDPETDQLDSIPDYVYIPPEDPDEGLDELPFLAVEQMPEFPGGERVLYEYLRSNTRFTQLAIEANIQGAVYIGFVIEKDGSVSNVTLVRGIGGGLDEVALSAVRSMPDWTPGKQRGIPVRVSMVVPFKFKLQ